MSTEQNELVARRIGEELFNQGNLSVADELIAPNAVDHNEPPGTDCREHFKRVATILRSAFPDLNMQVEDLNFEEDKAAIRIRTIGLHIGLVPLFLLSDIG